MYILILRWTEVIFQLKSFSADFSNMLNKLKYLINIHITRVFKLTQMQ